MPKRLPMLAALLLALSGCDADTEDLFGTTETSASGKGSSSAASMGGAGSTSGMGGAGPTAAGTTTNTAASSTADAATTVAASSSSGVPTTDVFCNGAACGPNQVCCISFIEDHCEANGACGFDGEMQCNGPDDCPGQKCCGKKNVAAWESSTCKPQCTNGEVVMCFDAPATCGGGQCKPIMDLGQGWASCGN